jgi:hypothetical protein
VILRAVAPAQVRPRSEGEAERCGSTSDHFKMLHHDLCSAAYVGRTPGRRDLRSRLVVFSSSASRATASHPDEDRRSILERTGGSLTRQEADELERIIEEGASGSMTGLRNLAMWGRFRLVRG